MGNELALKENGLLVIEKPVVEITTIPAVPRTGIEPVLPLRETGF